MEPETSEETLPLEVKKNLVDLYKYLLCGVDGKDEEEGDTTGSEVMDWVERTSTWLKEVDVNCLQTHFAAYAPLVLKMFLVLRECLLTHRWRDAVEMMVAITAEPTNTAVTVHKVGFELMQHETRTNDRILDYLCRQLKLLCELNAKEVVLDYFFYLLSQHKIEEAHDAFKTLKKEHLAHVRRLSKFPKDKLINEVLFKAYEGLVLYVEWLQVKHKLQAMLAHARSNEHGLYDDITEKAQQEEQHMRSLAAKACECFRVIQGQHGVWDIFITKQAELLEYIGQHENARNVLMQYAEAHDGNPNALKYLYSFYKKHGEEEEERIQILNYLVKDNPTDSMVFELYTLLQEKGVELNKLVPLVFNMLDYACWQGVRKPWQMLARLLVQIFQSGKEEDVAAVEAAWEIRASWWPQFHFSKYTASASTDDLDLFTHKGVTCAALLGREHVFVIAVAERLDDRSDLIQELQHATEIFAKYSEDKP